MKNKKLRGFTLIELIVVMAIFGIIMFGALQLIPPVMKMMVQADVHEGGNAAVSSISTYLENELTNVEYLDVYNSLPADGGETRAKDFAEYYYEGVLKKGSTVADPIYATGKIHVMTIDNSENGNGKISSRVYDTVFTAGNVTVTEDTAAYQEWAVNKAYYDEYSFGIKLGLYDDETYMFDSSDYVELATNISSKHTSFTIQASTVRNNNTTYSFMSNASMSLVNIFNRNGGGVSNYYVINEMVNEDDEDESAIVSITEPQSNREDNPEYSKARKYGTVDKGTRVFPVEVEDDDSEEDTIESYCFVYSYPTEIITK